MACLLARGTKYPHPGNVGKMVSVLENSGSAETDRADSCESQAHKYNKNKLDVHAHGSEKPSSAQLWPQGPALSQRKRNRRCQVNQQDRLSKGGMHYSFIYPLVS